MTDARVDISLPVTPPPAAPVRDETVAHWLGTAGLTTVAGLPEAIAGRVGDDLSKLSQLDDADVLEMLAPLALKSLTQRKTQAAIATLREHTAPVFSVITPRQEQACSPAADEWNLDVVAEEPAATAAATVAATPRGTPRASPPTPRGSPAAEQPDDDDDVQVRLEDQSHINQFGRLNNRLHDLEDDLKAKSSEHELLDDAANEIILADDEDPVRFAFGECYYEVTKDQAEELLETKKEKIAGEMAALEEELGTVRGTLADLKAKLYGRFGKNINLEE